MNDPLRILKGKKDTKKTPMLSKSMNMDIRVIGVSLCEILKLKQSFRKNKVVTGKTLFFVIDSFCTPHSICLNIGL